MSKTTTQADKLALLAKMEGDRQALARPVAPHRPVRSTVGAAWARTTALAAGAALGWPPFLKQPLRAMTAVALRDRFTELLRRSQVRRVSGPLHDPDLARLAKTIAEVREAAARLADEREIEQLRQQLDEQVRQLRAMRAARNVVPAPRKEAPAAPDVAASTRHAAPVPLEPPTRVAAAAVEPPPGVVAETGGTVRH